MQFGGTLQPGGMGRVREEGDAGCRSHLHAVFLSLFTVLNCSPVRLSCSPVLLREAGRRRSDPIRSGAVSALMLSAAASPL